MDFKNKFTVCGMKEELSCKNPDPYGQSPENRRADVTPQQKETTRSDFVRKQLAHEDRTGHSSSLCSCDGKLARW